MKFPCPPIRLPFNETHDLPCGYAWSGLLSRELVWGGASSSRFSAARRRPRLRRGSSMLLRGDLFRTTLQIGEALTVLRKLLQ